VSLLNPAEVFVDNPSRVGDPAPPPELPNNHLANHIADLFIDTTLPVVDVFTLTRDSDPTTAISTIITASDKCSSRHIHMGFCHANDDTYFYGNEASGNPNIRQFIIV